MLIAISGLCAQVPELKLPRPGSIVATQVIGEVTVIAGEQSRPLKTDERVRVGVTITTGRRSLLVLELSNGTTLQLGSESEMELEEFGQEPFSSSIKPKDVKEEPSLSRTRVNLLRGDVAGEVKRLKVQRGSSFTLTVLAGTLRVTEGSFHAKMQMTEIGLGMCTIDFRAGVAEFEPLGGEFAPLPPGRRLGFALETDKISGTLKLSPMPQAGPAPKRSDIARPTPAPKMSDVAPEPVKKK
jgi:hypothetical protein